MKVLIAVDGSSYTDMCIQATKVIGIPKGSQITAITVVPQHTFLGGLHFDSKWMKNKANRLNEVTDKAAKSLAENTTSRLSDSGFEVKPLVAWGKPAEHILQTVHSEKADLVILGAKGLTNSDHFPLGSVSSKVMKHAASNVLLVRERITKLRRIFMATDGSTHSNLAVDLLLSMRISPQVEIFLLTVLKSHVEAYLKMPTLNLETNRQIVDEFQKAEEEAARKLLQKTEKHFADKKFRVTPLLRRGEPSYEIINCSNAFNPEIVAVGSRGLGAVEGFLMGSVAQRVARHSRYSVLIVRQ